MAVTVRDDLMAVGSWRATVNNTPVLLDKLTVKQNGKRVPRKLHWLLYDSAGTLTYVGVLLTVTPGREGIEIGGQGVLWHLGSNDIGPIVDDREYVAGTDKLDNGSFDLDGQYWRTPSQDSGWVLSAGTASNAGGSAKDDSLEIDRKFPTRPGYSYRATALGVTGTGRLRVRTIYEGRFTPPNLLVNWLGVDALTIGPIAKPQYLPNPTLENGNTGWTVSPFMAIENNASKAFAGSWVLRVGPIGQHQVVVNGGFETGDLVGWVQVEGAWYNAAVAPAGGARVAATDGVPALSRKSLQADFDTSSPTAVTPFPAAQGEQWNIEGSLRRAGADGQALYQIYVIDQAYPSYDSWMDIVTLDGDSDENWHFGQASFSPPPDKVSYVPMLTVHRHTVGTWYLDNVRAVRIRGNNSGIYSAEYAALPTHRYRFSALVTSDVRIGGNITLRLIFKGAGLPDQESTAAQSHPWGKWVEVAVEAACPAGYTTMVAAIDGDDIIGGSFWLDNTTLTKVDNNTATSTGTAIAVTPERTYRWSQSVRSGANLQRGTVKLSATCTRAGYPDVVVDSSPMAATAGASKELVLDFTPPSGYATVVPRVIGTDIEGDNWYVGAGQLRDTDTSTVVFDVTSDNPAGAAPLVNSTAPVGAESVWVAVIAEQGSTNWTVGSVALIRTGVTPVTGNAIVADVLKDPKTGLGLSIAAGTLSAPAVIPHDWLVQKRTNRQILDHLCNVIYQPALEYYVAPGLPPTLSVGPRSTVFSDLTDYILLLSDRQVVDIPPAESNVELRPTHIELIGAERQTLSGRTSVISATAAVPGPVEYDFNNRPIVRTETVTDSTVDHQAYADAYAADLAAKRAEPPLQVTIRLSGTDLTPCKVGDTIYPYYPAAGLEDQSNPRVVEGETVFPRGVRVLSRLATKGPSHSCVMRNPDGTPFPISPLWSKEDSTELTVGDRVEDWTSDPQGHAASIQFMRQYRSRPR